MDEMESRLNAILSNPEMMQQIMSMAQTLGSTGTEQPKPKTSPSQQPPPQPPQTIQQSPGMGIDLNTIQRIAGLAQRSGIDSNQRALLHALQPYLSKDRISKLERAMRAAKLASAAGFAFGGTGQQGRGNHV